MVMRGHQDGIDRFELRGPATKSKHQTLEDYSDLLGPVFSDYKVYAFARPPVERIISLYYSPHRWMHKKVLGRFGLAARNKPIDLKEFEALVSSSKSISDLLDITNISGKLIVGQSARHASGALVSLLDYATLQSGLERFSRENGFDLSDMPAKKVNTI